MNDFVEQPQRASGTLFSNLLWWLGERGAGGDLAEHGPGVSLTAPCTRVDASVYQGVDYRLAFVQNEDVPCLPHTRVNSRRFHVPATRGRGPTSRAPRPEAGALQDSAAVLVAGASALEPRPPEASMASRLGGPAAPDILKLRLEPVITESLGRTGRERWLSWSLTSSPGMAGTFQMGRVIQYRQALSSGPWLLLPRKHRMCAVRVTGNQGAQVTGDQIAQAPKALSHCAWFVEGAVRAAPACRQGDRQVRPGPQAQSCRTDPGCFQSGELDANQCNFLRAIIRPVTSLEQEVQEALASGGRLACFSSLK